MLSLLVGSNWLKTQLGREPFVNSLLLVAKLTGTFSGPKDRLATGERKGQKFYLLTSFL